MNTKFKLQYNKKTNLKKLMNLNIMIYTLTIICLNKKMINH